MSNVPRHEQAGAVDPAALAHDLANLVQAVSGNLELLAARTGDEQALRYLANARSAARQLEELTRRLRDGDHIEPPS